MGDFRKKLQDIYDSAFNSKSQLNSKTINEYIRTNNQKEKQYQFPIGLTKKTENTSRGLFLSSEKNRILDKPTYYGSNRLTFNQGAFKIESTQSIPYSPSPTPDPLNFNLNNFKGRVKKNKNSTYSFSMQSEKGVSFISTIDSNKFLRTDEKIKDKRQQKFLMEVESLSKNFLSNKKIDSRRISSSKPLNVIKPETNRIPVYYETHNPEPEENEKNKKRYICSPIKKPRKKEDEVNEFEQGFTIEKKGEEKQRFSFNLMN